MDFHYRFSAADGLYIKSGKSGMNGFQHFYDVQHDDIFIFFVTLYSGSADSFFQLLLSRNLRGVADCDDISGMSLHAVAKSEKYSSFHLASPSFGWLYM